MRRQHEDRNREILIITTSPSAMWKFTERGRDSLVGGGRRGAEEEEERAED